MTERDRLLRDYSLTDAQRQEQLLCKIATARAELGVEALALTDNILRPLISTLEPPPGINDAWGPDYKCKPVSVRTFIEHPDYLNLKGSIYPRILDDLEQLNEGDYEEVVLGGAQRWGKNVFAELGIAYEIYVLSCMKDRARQLGVIPGTELSFLSASLTFGQARGVFFDGLMAMLKKAPYFTEHFPFDQKVTSEIRFLLADIVCRPVAANEQAMMGYNVVSAVVDEANFMRRVQRSMLAVPGKDGRYDQVQAMYDRVAVRAKHSWNLRGAKMPGRIWVLSSARYPGDFVERKELEALHNPKIFVRRYAVWETKPAGTYSGNKFWVEVGDVTRRSRVLPDDQLDWPRDVNCERVIEVPQELRLEFERNVEQNVCDLAGISVQSLTPFIPKREAIRAMFDNGKREGMEPTFAQLEVTLQNPLPELERFVKENFHWIPGAQAEQSGTLDVSG